MVKRVIVATALVSVFIGEILLATYGPSPIGLLSYAKAASQP